MEAQLWADTGCVVDLSSITDEDLLRKMWQQAEDFSRKKEIRAYMYKLREQRLKDFYASNDSSPPYFLMENASATFGLRKSAVTGSHGDSLVDQSFESFKTKEIRDSESPTRFGSERTAGGTTISTGDPAANSNTGWQVRMAEEVSEDGKTHTVRSSATTGGTYELDGGHGTFSGRNEESHSERYEEDEQRGTRGYTKGDQSSTFVEESTVTEGTDGRRTVTASQETSTTMSTTTTTQQQQQPSRKELSKDPERVQEAFRLAACAGRVIERDEQLVNATTKMITETKQLDDGTTVTTRTYAKIGEEPPLAPSVTSSSTTTTTQQETTATGTLASSTTAKIQVEVDAAHDSFVRSLRCASPPVSGRSSVSPVGGGARGHRSPSRESDTCRHTNKPDYMRSTFTSERKQSNFSEEQALAAVDQSARPGRQPSTSPVRKVPTNTPNPPSRSTSPIKGKVPLMVQEDATVEQVTGGGGGGGVGRTTTTTTEVKTTKPPLVRSETYEERCRKILGMPTQTTGTGEGEMVVEKGETERATTSIFSTYDNTITTTLSRSEQRSEKRRKLDEEIKAIEAEAMARAAVRRASSDQKSPPTGERSGSPVKPVDRQQSPSGARRASGDPSPTRKTSQVKPAPVSATDSGPQASQVAEELATTTSSIRSVAELTIQPTVDRATDAEIENEEQQTGSRRATNASKTIASTTTTKQMLTKQSSETKFERRGTGTNATAHRAGITSIKSSSDIDVKRQQQQQQQQPGSQRPATVTPKNHHITVAKIKIDPVRKPSQTATPGTGPRATPVTTRNTTGTTGTRHKAAPAPVDTESDKETGVSDSDTLEPSVPSVPSGGTIEITVTSTGTGAGGTRTAQRRRPPVTDRKDSAPVYRTTGAPAARTDKSYARSASDNHLRATTTSTTTTTTTATRKTTPAAPHAPTGRRGVVERPVKHVATKTINLSSKMVVAAESAVGGAPADRPLDSDHLDNVIIDIQQAKSSREPTPNRLVPIPVSPDEDTGRPRFPDAVQEPDDESEGAGAPSSSPSAPRVKNIPIFEEATNAYVGCEITEVEDQEVRAQRATRITNLDRVTEDDESLLSVTEKVSKFVQEAQRLQETGTGSGPDNGARFVARPRDHGELDEHLRSDECLLSVSDKVTKFISTAEEVKKIRTSSPFVMAVGGGADESSVAGGDATTSDECLLSVNEKVSRFANRSQPGNDAPTVPRQELEVASKFAPQKSPELVKNAMKCTSVVRCAGVEHEEQQEPPSPGTVGDRYRTVATVSKVRGEVAPALRSTEAVKKAKEIFEKAQDGSGAGKGRVPRDILARPSIWEDRRNKEQQSQSDVKLTDIGVYRKTSGQLNRDDAEPDGGVEEQPPVTPVPAKTGGRRDSDRSVRAPAYIRDTVSSKKDLFEKRISSSKLQTTTHTAEYTSQTSHEEPTPAVTASSRKSSLKQGEPGTRAPPPVAAAAAAAAVDHGPKPSYMNHTVASLEHINTNVRRESLDHGATVELRESTATASVRSSGSSKFGVELKRLDSGNRITATAASTTTPTPKRPSISATDGAAASPVEEIFELDVLERLLESVTGYEQRRRIRAQIRIVKKQSQTGGEHQQPVGGRRNTGATDSSSPTRRDSSPRKVQSSQAASTAASIEQETVRMGNEKAPTTPKTVAVAGKADERPIWATSNILKKASENTRTFKGSSTSTTTTTTMSAVSGNSNGGGGGVVKRTTTTSSSFRQQHQQQQQKPEAKSEPKGTTDCITSSYGVGPTDENGLPLFGIRALKKQKAAAAANGTVTTEGTILTETLYSENGGPVVGERTRTDYATIPVASESGTSGAHRHPGTGLMAISTRKEKIGGGGGGGGTELTDGVQPVPVLPEPKIVRKGSVKELKERFVHLDNAQQREQPKVGLTMRTAGSQSHTTGQSSRASTPAAGSYDETCYEDVHQGTARSFLNDTSKVTDVQDVLERMPNADNVIESGDTAEEREARALLNKFLGASVLMSGVESLVGSPALPDQQEQQQDTVTKKVSVVSSSTRNTTRNAVRSTAGSGGTGTTARKLTVSVDNLEEVWDESVLKQLLEQSSNYEQRRKIRARIRQIMAEKEAVQQQQQQQQQITRTVASSKVESQDGGTVTTRSSVTMTKTVASAGPPQKPMSPFAKFRQLDKQNSTQSPPNSPKTPTTPTTPSAAMGPMFKFTDPALNRRAATVKDQLLQWCQMKTKEYENVKIENFSTSWSDGMAFCALIHHFLPDAFDFSQLTPQQRRHNFTLAFRVADDKAGIAPLLDVDDMVAMRKPDWKCVFTYVQSIYRRFKNED